MCCLLLMTPQELLSPVEAMAKIAKLELAKIAKLSSKLKARAGKSPLLLR